jgi:hypothetical protein
MTRERLVDGDGDMYKESMEALELFLKAYDRE